MPAHAGNWHVGCRHRLRSFPNDEFYSIRSFGAEDRRDASQRIAAKLLTRKHGEAVGAFAEINGLVATKMASPFGGVSEPG